MRSDELDKILDGALASYSQEEPRLGLDARILNRTRAEGHAPRFVWLRWAIAIPALACLLMLALTFWSKHDSTPAPLKPMPTIAKALPTSPIVPRVAHLPVATRRPKRFPLPKREQFPTPAPLTVEERALLAFVAHSPKQAQEVFADARSRNAEPIQIKEIHIEPLQDGGQ